MRIWIRLFQQVLLVLFVGALPCILLVGCKTEGITRTEPDIPTELASLSVGCRITSLTRTIASWSPPSVSKATWTYDANNMLIMYDDPSKSVQYPTHIDYTYDAKGYLVSARKAYVYIGTASLIHDTVTTNYEYETGRLRREIIGGQVVMYNYNQSGSLTSIVNGSSPYGDSVTDIFSAGKLTDRIILYYGSATEDHPYIINNGLIVRAYARNRNYYTNYTYDEQGRQTKIEEFDNGTVRQYYTLTYTDGKPYHYAQSLPKGWPEILRKKLSSNEGQTGLPTEWVRYMPSLPGSTTLFKNMVTSYVYTKNEQGYPLRCEYTTTGYSAQGDIVSTPSRIIEIYTYEGCN